MHVIQVRNVAEALPAGINHLHHVGKLEATRAGPCLVAPTPVTTIYERPLERVLTSSIRDANPFFHLFEALWMLAGRRDAKFLDLFVKDFSDRFAEPGGSQWGAYGFRWRHHFNELHDELELDQIGRALELLRAQPNTRQIVITMWDPTCDLNSMVLRDRPCNTHIYLRLRENNLDMTVLCRSNDIVWGAYGANAVHFSVLQEYIAAHLGCPVGVLYQISNNYHAYVQELDRLKRKAEVGDLYELSYRLTRHEVYPTQPLVANPALFDEELRGLLEWVASDSEFKPIACTNPFLVQTALHMAWSHRCWREGNTKEALRWAEAIKAPDWRQACVEWIARRT